MNVKFFRPVFALVMAIVVAGCSSCATSNSALRGHTTAATALDDIADEARGLVLDQRQAKLDSAAAIAKVNGADIGEAVDKAAAEFDSGPAIPAVNAFVAAKDLYVRAVLSTAADERPTWNQAKAMLIDAIDAYTALRAALGDPSTMPAIPDTIAKLLSQAPRPGAGAEVVA